MRVLFYLPAVTSWWFEHVVEPILRRIAAEAEVHVLAPAPWQNTGIGPNELAYCTGLPRVAWHIVDGDDHPSLRTAAADPDAVVDFVCGLAPDVTLCRTADFATAARFPGMVRYLMEVAAAPFDVAACTTTITADPFGNGAIPDLDPADLRRLDALIDPLWGEMTDHWRDTIPDRAAVFRALGVADDRPMLMLPLEYEHEENFFLQHRMPHRDTLALLVQVAQAVTPGCTLVVTDHPLNTLYVDRSDLKDTVARMGPDVVLSDARIGDVPATLALARHADGMLLGDSKSFGFAAVFGTPMLRRSRFASGGWLNDGGDLDRFVAGVRAGQARGPAESDTRRWFAYHLANEAFYPKDPALTGAELLDRAVRQVNPARWDAGMSRVRAVKPATPKLEAVQ